LSNPNIFATFAFQEFCQIKLAKFEKSKVYTSGGKHENIIRVLGR